MTSVKRSFDDDDGDLKDIDADGRIGDEDEDDSDAEQVVDEVMEVPPTFPNLPDMWLAKLPKSLMDKWMDVKQPGIELAKMQVWANNPAIAPKIYFVLPDNPQYNTDLESKKYKFDIGAEDNEPTPVEINRYIFADVLKPEPPRAEGEARPPPFKRPRLTRLMGRVAHRGGLVPVDKNDEKYRDRFQQANERLRSTIVLTPEDEKAFNAQGRGNLKQMSAGMAKDEVKINLGTMGGKSKGPQDKRTRISRDQLVDRLMQLFKQRDMWTFKELLERTDQPEEYLRMTLPMIGHQHKSGPHTNYYELNDTQKTQLKMELEAMGEPMPGPSSSGSRVKSEGGGVKAENVEMVVDDDGDDDDDDDDDDDGFEQVA